MSGSILDLVQRLKAAGATAEMIADVLDTFAERLNAPTAAAEPARSKRQERNARYYDARKERLNASEKRLNKTSEQDGDGDNAPPRTHEEPQPKTQETSYPKTPLKGGKKGKVPGVEKASDRQQVLAAFDGVLSPARAAAVIEHRTKLRKPMTAHAAGLLAKQFAATPNPDEAADTMIARGWLGFNPDWGKGRGGTGPPSGRRTFGDIVDEGLAEIAGQANGHGHRETEHHDGPTLDLVAGGGRSDQLDLQPADGDWWRSARDQR